MSLSWGERLSRLCQKYEIYLSIKDVEYFKKYYSLQNMWDRSQNGLLLMYLAASFCENIMVVPGVVSNYNYVQMRGDKKYKRYADKSLMASDVRVLFWDFPKLMAKLEESHGSLELEIGGVLRSAGDSDLQRSNDLHEVKKDSETSLEQVPKSQLDGVSN